MAKSALALVLFSAAYVGLGCGRSGTEPSATSPTPPTGVTPPTEIHDGVLSPHEIVVFTFAPARAGLADIRISAVVNVPPSPPPLYLTVRRGSCPQSCGDIVADSANGSLAVELTAANYSLAVGNPNDQTLAFNLVMNYPT